MNDTLPTITPIWQHLEKTLRETLNTFGYQEIRTPIVEKTELFKRSIGEATDIVEKEMYTFLDRNNESLSLRPEGTASCVRAGIEQGLLYNQTPRLWYMGPYFRHERPQKGRYRQFHQCGAEVFGIGTPDIDAEMILLSYQIFQKLGLTSQVKLQLNSLGSATARAAYREKLVAYFNKNVTNLDEDSQRRLQTNPLRILDSKNPAMQDLIASAPKLIECLDDESAQHFNQLQQYLKAVEIDYEINPCLVRGLDYYNKTVFEWVTTDLGTQGTVCAGGRYDSLVEQLGGKPTPALGFAFGLERSILLLEQIQATFSTPLDVYFITNSPRTYEQGINVTSVLRQAFPKLSIVMHCGGGSFKNQFKKADKSGARIAMILADDELSHETIAIKFLREERDQTSVKQNDLMQFIADLFYPGA